MVVIGSRESTIVRTVPGLGSRAPLRRPSAPMPRWLAYGPSRSTTSRAQKLILPDDASKSVTQTLSPSSWRRRTSRMTMPCVGRGKPVDLQPLRGPEAQPPHDAIPFEIQVEVGLPAVEPNVVVQRGDRMLPRSVDDRMIRIEFHGASQGLRRGAAIATAARAGSKGWSGRDPTRAVVGA